ncbi:MAG: hypothetical protein JW753_11650 [Dehalococcoidia bacterium]|nr:hypothetical protein [Dehalococcoidia bacterium]
MTLVLGLMALFVIVFYPETLGLFAATGYLLIGLGFGLLIILALLITAIPRRRG